MNLTHTNKYRKYLERLQKHPQNQVYANKVEKYRNLIGGGLVNAPVSKINNII